MDRTKLMASLKVRELEGACSKARGISVKRGKREYKITAREALEEILRRVGPAGEQARADEARYFESFETEHDRSSSRKRGPIINDVRDISFACLATDCSAALLSFVEYGSFLRRHAAVNAWGDENWGGLHHLKISAYVVVRDATSGDRHTLRVPPRFGKHSSATFEHYRNRRVLPATAKQIATRKNVWPCEACDNQNNRANAAARGIEFRPGYRYWLIFSKTRCSVCRGKGQVSKTYDAAGLIREAVAWTFNLRPEEYHPQIAA